MTICEDLNKPLGGLTDALTETRGLVERMEAEHAAGAPEDAILDAEAVSVMRAIAINARQLRDAFAGMERAEIEAIIAECWDPEAVRAWLNVLGVGSGPREERSAD